MAMFPEQNAPLSPPTTNSTMPYSVTPALHVEHTSTPYAIVTRELVRTFGQKMVFSALMVLARVRLSR
jgi:hypothetical protein